MDAQIKIQIILFLMLFGVMLVGFMVIIQTIGSINHAFNRMEEIVSKETLLRFERLNDELAIQENARKTESERRRRNEALLNVPLMRSAGEEKSSEDKKSEDKKDT